MKKIFLVMTVILGVVLLSVGCSSIKNGSADEAMETFKTAMTTGDYTTMSKVWADMTASGLKLAWEGVTGTAQSEYLGKDDNGAYHYKLTYTLTSKPEGSKLGLSAGETKEYYPTVEKRKGGWIIVSLETTAPFAAFLTK